MYILEAAPIISDGPAWVIALSVVAGTIKVLSGQIFPFLGKKYDYAECQKNCAELKAEFETFKENAEKEKRLKLEEIAGIRKKWRKDGDRLIRAEVLMRTLKIALNKKGYDDFIHLLEEIVSKENEE